MMYLLLMVELMWSVSSFILVNLVFARLVGKWQSLDYARVRLYYPAASFFLALSELMMSWRRESYSNW